MKEFAAVLAGVGPSASARSHEWLGFALERSSVELLGAVESALTNLCDDRPRSALSPHPRPDARAWRDKLAVYC